MKKEIITLKDYFVGTGEVKGFIFNLIHSTQLSYLYEVNTGDSKYYEIFKRRSNATMVNFEKRVYSETVFKECYPKAKDFGVWAWTFKNLEDALKKIDQIEKDFETKN